ncbi:MAG: DUF393 domain-containing protein [Gammaproteobacteria bacterium]|nr:DUF393 domain-containing protein [Gammaproteobacteria bacterium]
MILFFDSHCPLCSMEMRHLLAHDKGHRVQLVDLHSEEFESAYPEIDKHEAMQTLHGRLESGEMVYGLDATHAAWSRVGKHRWLAVLRLPLIRGLANLGYRLFARHRSRISFLLTGRSRCHIGDGLCGIDDSPPK